MAFSEKYETYLLPYIWIYTVVQIYSEAVMIRKPWTYFLAIKLVSFAKQH